MPYSQRDQHSAFRSLSFLDGGPKKDRGNGVDAVWSAVFFLVSRRGLPKHVCVSRNSAPLRASGVPPPT